MKINSEPHMETAELCVAIEDNYDAFLHSLAQDGSETRQFQLNKRVLATAVSTCSVDIARFNEYAERRVSPVRFAAYVSYWIYKSKPIQLSETDGNGNSIDLFINEMFSIFVLFSFLKVDQREIAENYYFELVYHLRFRSIDPEHLYMMAAGLVASHRNVEVYD